MKLPFDVIATPDNGDSQDENVDDTGSDEINEQEQEQETATEDETDSENVAELDDACPAVAFEGPSYTDENGCPQPCPTDNQDGIPEGCPQPTGSESSPQSGPGEICNNGIDDDGNGQIDSDDSQCSGSTTIQQLQDPGLVIEPRDIILPDADKDGVPDGEDNCKSDRNQDQKDSDGDGIGDACDPGQLDLDEDGILGANDNCPYVFNPDQKDSDGDDVGDICDPNDSDKDGWTDAEDNCESVYNSDQRDSDRDGIGDVCETFVDKPRDDIGNLILTPPPLEQRPPLVEKPLPGDIVQGPTDESGIVEGPLPDIITTQRTPDTLFKGPNTGTTGVPLPDPVLVPGPNEERGDEEEDKEDCIIPYCDIPLPISQDEICRNEKDDDFDGRVDEDPYCSEVPGQSKPRTPDGVLTPSN